MKKKKKPCRVAQVECFPMLEVDTSAEVSNSNQILLVGNYFFLKNYVTSDGTVSHNALYYYQQCPVPLNLDGEEPGWGVDRPSLFSILKKTFFQGVGTSGTKSTIALNLSYLICEVSLSLLFSLAVNDVIITFSTITSTAVFS